MSANENQHNEPTASGAAKPNESVPPSISPQSIEGIFLQALQVNDTDGRQALIDEMCVGDSDRRNRVTALLRAYDDAGSFLETPAGGARPTNEVSLSFLKPINKEGVLGTIGPYEVLEVIGRGGMGVVLRAIDLKLNRIVAVKALLPELAANPNSRRRFLREAQAAAAISHPHVVTIHAVDDTHEDANGKPVPPYLVMECVIGQSLQEKLDRVGTMRLAEILRIGRQVSEGLAAAHKQGVIHRDIKPANILLENGVERVKITDFGLARAIDDITVTRTGEVSGTPQYMSPEQASGERVDHRSDLFSFGCVMYAMCTGHSPFRGDSIAHVIKRVTQDTPRPIADQNPEIPPWLVEIITCLLQKNPEQRFQSAEGVVAILDQHLQRIQHPSVSGSHTVINQRMPAAFVENAAKPTPSDEEISQTTAQPTVKHSDKGVSIPSCPTTPVLPSRFRISNVLLWIAVPFLCCGVLGLIALAQGARWWQIAGLPPIEIQSLTFWALGIAMAFLLPALFLRVSQHNSPPTTGSLIAWFLVGGPIGIMIWLLLRESHSRHAAASEADLSPPMNRYQVGTWLAGAGALIIFAMVAWFMLVRFDIIDAPQVANSIFAVSILSAAAAFIVFGMLLRGEFLGKQSLKSVQAQHAVATLKSTIRKWWILIVATCCFGFLAYWGLTDPTSVTLQGPSIPPTKSSATDTTIGKRIVILKHPDWGKIRKLMINKGGSHIAQLSPTETKLYPKPKLNNTIIQIHVILMDGREWQTYTRIDRPEIEIDIYEHELEIRHSSLVEVLDDSPDAKLRLISYPSQKKISVNSFFHINKAPFHKALQPRIHKVTLDYVLNEWDIPEGYVYYNRLEYRVTVPDTKPIKLSLKAILAEHGDKAKTHKMRWDPDFRPLSTDSVKREGKPEAPNTTKKSPAVAPVAKKSL